MYLALQMNREAEVISRWEEDQSAAGGRSRLNGAVHGFSINSLAVAGCAIRPYVEDAVCGCAYVFRDRRCCKSH